MVDCPSVFRHGSAWFMLYVCTTNKVGYETHLARSDDLLHWTPLGKCSLSETLAGTAGRPMAASRSSITTGAVLIELQPFDNRYWMSYLGGSLQGYETDRCRSAGVDEASRSR
jgi:hypothetical protein